MVFLRKNLKLLKYKRKNQNPKVNFQTIDNQVNTKILMKTFILLWVKPAHLEIEQEETNKNQTRTTTNTHHGSSTNLTFTANSKAESTSHTSHTNHGTGRTLPSFGTEMICQGEFGIFRIVNELIISMKYSKKHKITGVSLYFYYTYNDTVE